MLAEMNVTEITWDNLTDITRAYQQITPHHALVAQWIRASDYESEGCRFDPCRVHYLTDVMVA